MISKTTPPIEVLALLLSATAASAKDNRGTPEQRAACATRGFQTLQQLYPPPCQGRALLEAEQI
jgi:hypothetical protein